MPTSTSRPAGPRRRSLLLRAAPWLLLIVLCVAWNTIMFVQRGHDAGSAWLTGWDDNHYFAWGRSLAVDGDWDFQNDYAFVASLAPFPGTAGLFQDVLRRDDRTPAGRLRNKYACGLGLLALPWLLATRLLLALSAHFGFTGPPSPFSSLYVLAFSISGAVWGIVGLAAARRLLERDYGRRLASRTVLVGVLGLSLGYYVWFEPTMAHGTAFAAATLCLLCVRAWADRALATPDAATGAGRWAFLMGLTLGVACLVRYTNVVLALVPLVLVRAARASTPPAAARVRRSAALTAAGWLLGFAPQLIAWKVIYGSFVVYSYTGELLLPLPIFLHEVLLGPRSGLLLWTPLALLAGAGLWWGRRDRAWCRAGLATLGATLWIYSGWTMPWLGASFGMRAFVDVSFFLLLGLAELTVRTRSLPIPHPFRRVRPVLVGLAVVWTVHLAVCFRAHITVPEQSLALGRVMTEWSRWAWQIYHETGVRSVMEYARGKPS